MGRENIGLRLLLVAYCLFLVFLPIATAARNLVSGHDLEVQEHLKRLNKPPVKSIKSPDGDIIDCILTNQQLAFDHPLLKNHVIQMRPSSESEGLLEETKVKVTSSSKHNKKRIRQAWHSKNETCPDGTVSIRRTKEEDLLRASSLQEFGRKKHRTIPKLNSSSSTTDPAAAPSNHEYGIVLLRGDRYYGAKATINLWQPQIQQSDEFSLSQLWITAGSYQDNSLNTIEVGWQACPLLYGDSNPRLFNYWTSNAYQSSGCYNLKCSGFVQVSNNMVVGGTLGPVSEYSGSQHEIDILVWKDQRDGNWWLKLGDENLGYWPSSLFTELANGATDVQFGGEVVNLAADGQHTSTDMGSGHFPEEGFGKASYFKNIQTVDATNTLKQPNNLATLADHPACYNVKLGGGTPDMGTHFYYGGPGRNPNCP